MKDVKLVEVPREVITIRANGEVYVFSDAYPAGRKVAWEDDVARLRMAVYGLAGTTFVFAIGVLAQLVTILGRIG